MRGPCRREGRDVRMAAVIHGGFLGAGLWLRGPVTHPPPPSKPPAALSPPGQCAGVEDSEAPCQGW